MKIRLFSLLLPALLLVITSCEQVSVDPDGLEINIILDQSSTSNGPVDFVIDEAYLRLSEIEFEGEKKNDEEIEIEVEQVTTVNLLTGVADPGLPTISIPAGTYEEFELEVSGADDGGTVFFMKGAIIDSAQNQTPFEIDIREEFSLEVEWENFTLDSTTTIGPTFMINPMAWIDSLGVNQLINATLVDGIITISPDQNSDIYMNLVRHLPEGIEWEWDDEGN